METSAVLVNVLRQKLHSKAPGSKLAESDITAVFAETQETRFPRAVAAVNQGRHTNSASIKETLLSKMFVDYFFPRFGNRMTFSLIVKNTLAAPRIDGVPLPERYREAIARYEASHARTGAGWKTWSFLSLGVAVGASLVYTDAASVLSRLITV